MTYNMHIITTNTEDKKRTKFACLVGTIVGEETTAWVLDSDHISACGSDATSAVRRIDGQSRVNAEWRCSGVAHDTCWASGTVPGGTTCFLRKERVDNRQ